MTVVLEIVSPSGTRKASFDGDILRIGSASTSSVVVDQLPAHCLTIRQTKKQASVTNRMDRSIQLGRTKIGPNQTSKWNPGKAIVLPNDVSITLQREKAHVAPNRKPIRRKTSSKDRQQLILIVIAGMLCCWLFASLISNVDRNASRRKLRQAALQALRSGEVGFAENEEELANRKRVFRLVQDGALEDCRGNRDLAKAYYSRAFEYADRNKLMSKRKHFDDVYEFLHKELN